MTGEEKTNRPLICTLSDGQSLFKRMQAYSDNQADDVKGNGFHLLLYISYQAIKRAEEERKRRGGLSTSAACAPPSLTPLFTSSLTHPPLLILPVPTRIGSM